MAQKWNLQDIRPAEVKKRRQPPEKTETRKDNNNSVVGPSSNKTDDEIGTIVIKDKNKKSRFNFMAIVAVVVLLVGAIFGLSMFLSKTTLTVYPEFREPNVNAEFTAYPDKRQNALTYEILTIEETGERQVSASGQEHVEEQASGFIEIIKTTPGSERLIKNTRFRSPDGLVFRIQESVVVPGALKDGSGALVPGTIRAEVFADDIGQEYNLPAGTSFDVPGFKESNLNELYESIHAENREAFSGGFNGPRFIIDDNELSTAEQSLQMELRDKLLAKIESEKPADFVAFEDAVALTYNDLPSVQYGDNLVTIKQQAVLQLPLFKHGDFAQFLASETITTYSGEPVRIRNVEELNFSYTNPETSSSYIANLPSVNFSIVGKPLIVWEYDSAQLQTDLAGKPLTALSTVMSGHIGIDSAVVTGKPFWKRSFPDEAKDIVIVEELKDK
ncbi:MAG: hypothetical protein R3B60_04790 [Candidatus Paceibacterota bacterium]